MKKYIWLKLLTVNSDQCLMPSPGITVIYTGLDISHYLTIQGKENT